MAPSADLAPRRESPRPGSRAPGRGPHGPTTGICSRARCSTVRKRARSNRSRRPPGSPRRRPIAGSRRRCPPPDASGRSWRRWRGRPRGSAGGTAPRCGTEGDVDARRPRRPRPWSSEAEIAQASSSVFGALGPRAGRLPMAGVRAVHLGPLCREPGRQERRASDWPGTCGGPHRAVGVFSHDVLPCRWCPIACNARLGHLSRHHNGRLHQIASPRPCCSAAIRAERQARQRRT